MTAVYTPEKQESLPDSQKSQFLTIFLLFLTLRFTILFLYKPEGLLAAYSDYHYYFRTAKLSDLGYYPFINMWYEYPPISAYIVQAVYWLSRVLFPFARNTEVEYLLFQVLFGLVTLVFDAGVLLLIFRLVRNAWGVESANLASWVYACLGLPLFYWSFSHHIVGVFFTLLALDLFINHKNGLSAFAIGMGTVTKVFPIVLFPVTVKFTPPPKLGKAIKAVLIILFVIAITYMPFVLLGGGKWILASLAALGKVGSWSTIWAMIDGNWGPGNYGPLQNRLDLALGYVRQHNPPRIPGILTTLTTALIYGWFWLRPINDNSAKNIIRFSTLTIMLYHLWSKGWSPQWATLIIPFLLITFPNKRGIITSLLLNLIVIIEWPISGFFETHFVYSGAIITRTALFILVLIWCAKGIWPSEDKTPIPSSARSLSQL